MSRLKYYNYEKARENVISLANEKKRVLVVSNPRIGLTSFLTEIKSDLRGKTIYWLEKPTSDIAQDLYEQLISYKYSQTQTKLINKILGAIPFVNLIPKIGPTIGDLLKNFFTKVKEINIEGCYTGEYQSRYAEGIIKYLTIYGLQADAIYYDKKSIERKPYNTHHYVIIDNILNLNDDSLKFLYTISELSHVHLIIGIARENVDSIEKIKNILELPAGCVVELKCPDAEIISGIIKINNKGIKKIEECQKILEEVERDMHRFTNFLRNDFKKEETILTNKQIYILKVLYHSPFALKKNELNSLVDMCFEINENFDNDLQCLVDNELISQHDYILVQKNNSYFNNADNFSENERGYIVGFILEYFYKKSLFCKIDEIQYIIKNIQGKTREELNKLRELCIIKSVFEGEIRIGKDILDGYQPNTDEMIIATAFLYYRKREYKDARNLLKNHSNKTDAGYNLLVILSDVRLRKYSEVISRINEIYDNFNNKQKALLLASLATAYLHGEDMKSFDKLCERELEHQFENPQGGYFLRIIGGHQIYKDPITVFEKAIECFNSITDNFGALTTEINMLTYIIDNNRNKDLSIFEKLKSCEKEMNKTSEVHKHILFNTLGLYHLLIDNNFDSADEYFKKGLALSFNTDMPNVFLTVNRAMTKLRKGDISTALSIIKSVQKVAEEASFKRIKQKYYINRALIEIANQSSNAIEYLELAKQYPDRRNPERSHKVIEKLKNCIERRYSDELFNELYTTCYLEYWYPNPSKFIDFSAIDKVLSL